VTFAAQLRRNARSSNPALDRASAAPGTGIEEDDARRWKDQIASLYERDGKPEFRTQFDWYYRDCGQELPRSFLLRDRAGKIQGLISVTVRTLRFDNKLIRAGVTGNLMVDRASGIYFGASSLVRASQDLVQDGSLDLLLGIPNEYSQAVFQRLKFFTLDRWRTYAMLFRSTQLLRSRFGFRGMLASPLVDFYASARRLVSRYRRIRQFQIEDLGEHHLAELQGKPWLHSGDRIKLDATPDYLNWRFLRHPSRHYQIKGVRAPSGALCGYVAVRHAAGRAWVVACEVDRSVLTEAESIASLCRTDGSHRDSVWVACLGSGTLSQTLNPYGFLPVSASLGGYPDYPLVGFWRSDHPLAGQFSRSSSWDLLTGFNDI
jgi:hypothetical protein